MKSFVILSLVFLFVELTAVCQGKSKIPRVLLRNMDGKVVNSSEIIRPGKPVIICFWASWCRPCIKELSAIGANYRDWQDETGIVLYAISVDESRSQNYARILISSNSWDFEFYFDSNGDFKRAMGVVNIPHTFILNSAGEIVYQHVSYTEGSELEIIRRIREISMK